MVKARNSQFVEKRGGRFALMVFSRSSRPGLYKYVGVSFSEAFGSKSCITSRCASSHILCILITVANITSRCWSSPRSSTVRDSSRWLVQGSVSVRAVRELHLFQSASTSIKSMVWQAYIDVKNHNVNTALLSSMVRAFGVSVLMFQALKPTDEKCS